MHTATTNPDLRELITQINVIGRTWLDPMPPDLPHMDALPERLDGFVHSFLINLEGAGGTLPHRLSPKGRADLDLAAEAPREVWGSEQPVSPTELEALFVAIRRFIAKHSNSGDDNAAAMLGLICDLTQHLAAGFELVPLYCDDDTGKVLSEGADLATALGEAYPEAWSR